MSDSHVYFANQDEWNAERIDGLLVDNRPVAVITNPDSIHRLDKALALRDYPTICGDCSWARTPACVRCFNIPTLLIHDTFTAAVAR